MPGNAISTLETADASEKLDEGRTGTWLTASAHIITAVIGSGVLSLAWAIAQLGWIGGPIALLVFSLITWLCSVLLADCAYNPSANTRYHTYMDVVKANLGGMKVKFCGIAQYTNLVGVSIGYTITAAISLGAIKRSNCYHKKGHDAACHSHNNVFMSIYGGLQIILSQIPNFHKLSILSIIAAVMSFAYSSIGLGLAAAKLIADLKGGSHEKTSLTGIPVGEGGLKSSQKVWNTFQALGNIAFAYAFSMVLVEIQNTLKPKPPQNVEMKKAAGVGICVTTLFYMSCGVVGYAAFGHNSPGDFLTGFGFYEPFWLVDFANMCVAVHLVGAYQVYSQPFFGLIEGWCRRRWPESEFIAREYPIRTPFGATLGINFFRLIWRTSYVIFTTVIAMLLPFFNAFVGLLGAAAFWPLTVYLPIEMYISKAKIRGLSPTWIWLQVLSMVCLVVSLLAGAGSVQGLITAVRSFKPFHSVS